MPTDLNWTLVDNTVNPRLDVLEYTKVQHLFKHAAFDVYQQDGTDKLWQLVTEDGKEYLVALYESDGDNIVVKSQDAGEWKAAADTEGKNVTLSYKDYPVYRFASDKYSFDSTLAEQFAEFVAKRANHDPVFVNQLLDQMPRQKKVKVAQLLNEGAF